MCENHLGPSKFANRVNRSSPTTIFSLFQFTNRLHRDITLLIFLGGGKFVNDARILDRNVYKCFVRDEVNDTPFVSDDFSVSVVPVSTRLLLSRAMM